MYEEIEDTLNKIYAKIPDFSCKHCHKCCGPIMWFKPEDMVINNYLKKQKIKKIIWTLDEFKKNNMKCPYLIDDRCIIYEVRPIVCRLQGNISELRCKIQKYCKKLNVEELNFIKNEFVNLIRKTKGMNEFYSTLKL